MEEGWYDEPELIKKSSSTFEAVYSTNKFDRGFNLLQKE